MVEIASNFEQVAMRFNPAVLIGTGIIFALLGLVIWLGGFGFRKPLLAAAGAIIGALCSYFVIDWNVILTVVIALVAAAVALLFERIFITIIAVCLAAVLAYVIIAGPDLEKSAQSTWKYRATVKSSAESLSIPRTIQKIQTFSSDIAVVVRSTNSRMSLLSKLIIAAVMLAVITAGYFIWPVICSLCCSVLGTMLVFAGMILLLIFKGSMPLTHINDKPFFYFVVSGAMIAFGTVEQLVLCRNTKGKIQKPALKITKPKKQEPQMVEQEPEQKVASWRTS